MWLWVAPSRGFGDPAGSGRAHRDMLKFKYHGGAGCVYRGLSRDLVLESFWSRFQSECCADRFRFKHPETSELWVVSYKP
jgi:hypothetical protein